MGQLSFTEAEYSNRRRRTKREDFLDLMDEIIQAAASKMEGPAIPEEGPAAAGMKSAAAISGRPAPERPAAVIETTAVPKGFAPVSCILIRIPRRIKGSMPILVIQFSLFPIT